MLRGSRMSASAKAKMRAAKLGKPSNNRAWMAANRAKYGKSMPPSMRAKLRAASLANGSCPPSRAGTIPWNKDVHGDPQIIQTTNAAHKAWRKKHPTKAARRAWAIKAMRANQRVSRVERRFLDALQSRLKQPVQRQVQFTTPNGRHGRFRVDGLVALSTGKLVAVEVDGSAYWHRLTQAHQARRDRSLRARGVAVIRVTESQLRDWDGALQAVTNFIRQKEG